MLTAATCRRRRGAARLATLLALLALLALVAAPAAAAPAAQPPSRFSEQWNLRQIGVESAWTLTRGRSDIIVGVIDTGVDASHPELKGKVVPGRNTVDNNDRTGDIQGHGTFIAGLIAARGVEMWGVAPNVKIMPLRVFGPGTSVVDPANDYLGVAVATANALRWGVDHGARIFNISLGWNENVRELQEAIDYAWSQNALVFVSAGNEDQDWTIGEPAPSYPAASRHAVGVAATNTKGEHASYSNTASYILLSAPGGDYEPGSSTSGGSRKAQFILGPKAGTKEYTYLAGTSFASPHVAGLAALIWSAQPDLTNQEVLQILYDTAQKPGNFAGRSNAYGWGRIDAGRAVTAALRGPVALAITAPSERADVSGAVEIAGWAGMPPGVAPESVEIKVFAEPADGGDQTLLGQATTGLPVPDPAPQGIKPSLATTGYRFLWNPGDLPKGTYRLTVVETVPSGDRASNTIEVEVK